jgi:diaminopimelate decarboxylase
MTLAPFRAAYARLADVVRYVRAEGHSVEVVDCGGGLGVPYRNEPFVSPAGLAGALHAAFGGLDVRLQLEPGRWLVAGAGLLVSSVLMVKHVSNGMRFVVLDAAMNDLLRPTLYNAWHGIVPLSAADAVAPAIQTDVVGPVCESGDTLARSRLLPPLVRNARVAILDVGAYGSVMSSTYNARPLAPAVLVDGERWSLIRSRQQHEALWRDEHVPESLA